MQKFKNIILRAFTNVNKNGIVVFLHSMKANGWGGAVDVEIHSFLTLALYGSGQPHTPAALLRGKSQRHSQNRKVGELHSRSGRIRKEGNFLPLRDSNPGLSRP